MLVDSVAVVIRAFSFVALFQAAGIALFMATLGQPLTVSALPIRRVACYSAWAAIVLVASHQLLTAARMTGEFSGAMNLSMQLRAWHSPAATANVLRMVGLLLIATTIMRKQIANSVTSVIGALLVVLSFPITGHVSSNPRRWLLAPLLLSHLWVMTFWFGSLWALYSCSARETTQITATLVAKFSAMASWLVPSIAMAGVVMAVMLLPDVAALLTPYGLLLLAKMAGFALMMGLAALNKWRLGPALEKGDRGAKDSFRRIVIFEYSLICLVLSVTAVMTGLFSPEP